MKEKHNQNKKQILVWAGWYPTPYSEQGIFIKKHLEIIGKNNTLRVFHIAHQNHPFTGFKRLKIKDNFGQVTLYFIPSLIIIKHLAYLFIPFLEALKMKKIDVFHLHITYPYALFTYFLDIFNIRKYVASEHWSGFTKGSGLYDKLPKWSKKMFTKRLRKFEVISVVSPFLQKKFQEKTNHPNTIVIPNKIELVRYQTIKQKIQQKPYFISICNLDDRVKNISLIIKTFAKITPIYPAVKIDIYGDGKDRDFLINMAKDLQILNKNVFFKGYIQNHLLQEKYASYDAFMLLSNFETFSIVTFEAIFHGLPVIVTKCGGVEDYVNEKNGLLVPLDDIEATEFALIDMLGKLEHGFYQNLDKTLALKEYDATHISNLFGILYE